MNFATGAFERKALFLCEHIMNSCQKNHFAVASLECFDKKYL